MHKPATYKGAKGGRASGKSHEFATMAVEAMVTDPSLRFVCIREVQRSLKFSAKSLIEAKIRALGVSDLFDVLTTEIRRKGGTGVMIFEGMQDHTADSLKSLEGFGRAWVEEAQSISKRSLDLLLPTIRAEGSEIWFTWNPDQPSDPIDDFLVANPPGDAVVTHVNYRDNPWCPTTARVLAEQTRRTDQDAYAHIWLGEYNVKSDAIVLAGKWREAVFNPKPEWDGPYYGSDWGYSQDPTTLTRCWVGDRRLWIEYEAGGVGVDLDDTPALFRQVPESDRHVIRADSARPETIAHMRKQGFNVQPAPKWSGSVEDGIAHLRGYDEIVIHERCRQTISEARLWRFKTDRLTGDPLPKLQPGNEHYWDSIRYALSPLIQQSGPTFQVW